MLIDSYPVAGDAAAGRTAAEFVAEFVAAFAGERGLPVPEARGDAADGADGDPLGWVLDRLRSAGVSEDDADDTVIARYWRVYDVTARAAGTTGRVPSRSGGAAAARTPGACADQTRQRLGCPGRGRGGGARGAGRPLLGPGPRSGGRRRRGTHRVTLRRLARTRPRPSRPPRPGRLPSLGRPPRLGRPGRTPSRRAGRRHARGGCRAWELGAAVRAGPARSQRVAPGLWRRSPGPGQLPCPVTAVRLPSPVTAARLSRRSGRRPGR
ncbi:hypothetical protein NKH77_01070 [Streptomyces sp. M19]